MSKIKQFRCFVVGCNNEHSVTPPGSASSHRAGLKPGMPAREVGALPRRLKATSSSVSR